MIEWENQIDAGGKFGVCTVREHTDEEVNAAREQGLNFAHCDGFVNLFHGEKFVGWCGKTWAENRKIIKPVKMAVDVSKPVRLYDGRNKTDDYLFVRSFIYTDKNVCLATASFEDQVDSYYILLDLNTGKSLTSEFDSWIAENF